MSTIGGKGFCVPPIPTYTGKNSKRNARRKNAPPGDAPKPKKSFVMKTHRENEYSSEEEEEEEEYRRGGYHPVELGNVFANRYKVHSKLGWGHFSTVWLAKDLKDNEEVALKIVKSASHYTDAARDEIEILKTVAKNDPNGENCVIRLLNDFTIGGPHGTHVSMVFEKLGCNLLTLIRMYRYRGLPLPVVRMVTKQMAIGIAYLHRCHIIHTDLKPENLLLVVTPRLIKEMSRDKKRELTHLHRSPSPPRQVSNENEKRMPICDDGQKSSESPVTSPSVTRLIDKVNPHNREYHGNWGSPVVTPSGSPLSSPRTSLTKEISVGDVAEDKKGGNSNSKLEQDGGSKESGENDTRIVEAEPNSKKNDSVETQAAVLDESEDERRETEETEGKEDSARTMRTKLKLPWEKEDLLAAFGNHCRVKIVDLGNACWTYKHFTDDVQTRQYRAPEVILGSKYDQTIDVWSMACIVFELITGDLLFEPKSGRSFDKNDDHLAQMQELLGRFPRHIALSGRNARNYFTRRGELRYIKNLKFWYLENVLMEKYKFSTEEAESISSFLLPMLNIDPRVRISSKNVLEQPWIRDIDPNNFETAFNS